MKKIYYPISRRPARHLVSSLDKLPPRVRAQGDLFVYNKSKVEKMSGLKVRCLIIFLRACIYSRALEEKGKNAPLFG